MATVYLIGMMGVGKSFWGKRLADLMHYNFVDLDEYIAQKTGESVPEIFARHGETYFRQIEREALHKISEQSAIIIACGGGTPCFFDNMDFMLANGVVVWLDPDLEITARRIWLAKNKRPLIAHAKDEPAALRIITELQGKRKPVYQRAAIIEKESTINLPALIEKIKENSNFV